MLRKTQQESQIVAQDFEGLTPNLLARTIETVEGGGAIVLLLTTLTSLKQLYTLTMDAHARLRTESHQVVTGGHLAVLWVLLQAFDVKACEYTCLQSGSIMHRAEPSCMQDVTLAAVSV